MLNNNTTATCPACGVGFTGKRSRTHPNDDGTAIYALIEHLETCAKQCRYCLHFIRLAAYPDHETSCKAEHYANLEQ